MATGSPEQLLELLEKEDAAARKARAMRALARILDQTGLSQMELSQALGMQAPGPKDRGRLATVHRWLKGHDAPALRQLRKIEALEQGLLRLRPVGEADGRMQYELAVEPCPTCGGAMRRELGLDMCDTCTVVLVPEGKDLVACDNMPEAETKELWRPELLRFGALELEYRRRIWGQHAPQLEFRVTSEKVTPNQGIEEVWQGALVTWRNCVSEPLSVVIRGERAGLPPTQLPAVGQGECVGFRMPPQMLGWSFEAPFCAAGTLRPR